MSLCDSMFLQVVKRGERLSEYVHPRADTKAMTGSKRFRDRIGSTSNGFLLTNKRCVLFCFFVNVYYGLVFVKDALG